jgi:hypothetical protein
MLQSNDCNEIAVTEAIGEPEQLVIETAVNESKESDTREEIVTESTNDETVTSDSDETTASDSEDRECEPVVFKNEIIRKKKSSYTVIAISSFTVMSVFILFCSLIRAYFS